MNKLDNFSIVRSHLEYGHKVEGRNDKVKRLFIGLDRDVLIDEYGQRWQDFQVESEKYTSITPIPHRYKKLEVGTRVDVLEGCNLELACGNGCRKGLVLAGYEDCGNKTEKALLTHNDCYAKSSLPLWAIAPHVEGKKGDEWYMENYPDRTSNFEDYLLVANETVLELKRVKEYADGGIAKFETKIDTKGGKTYKVLITKQS